MKIIGGHLTYAAMFFLGLSSIAAGRQLSGDRSPGSQVIHKNVLRFQDFAAHVQRAASLAGVSAAVADHLLQELAHRNNVRLIPYAEWRTFLLEALYSDNIPYDVARSRHYLKRFWWD